MGPLFRRHFGLIVAVVGVSSRMLSAHTNLIEGEDGTFPEKSLSLVYSKHRTCVSFILISGLWTKKVVKRILQA